MSTPDFSYPIAAWNWYDGKGGIFSTQISAGGQVQQERKSIKADPSEVAPQPVGTLPAVEAVAFIEKCRAVPTSTADVAQDKEWYELVLRDSEGAGQTRRVARDTIAADPGLQNIQKEVLGIRNKLARRWNMWRCAGARWFYLTLAVLIALSAYMSYDMKHTGAQQSRGQQVQGVVIDKGGEPYKSEYLQVKLSPPSGAPVEVKISQYLSHPNWEASKPGGNVDVVYDAASGHAWLLADLVRWEHDKKYIWIFPLFLFTVALIGLGWLRRYEIGLHAGGEEYMILGDRVVADDQDAIINRSAVLWWKMFV